MPVITSPTRRVLSSLDVNSPVARNADILMKMGNKGVEGKKRVYGEVETPLPSPKRLKTREEVDGGVKVYRDGDVCVFVF